MSEALGRIVEMLGDGGEEEAAAVLRVLGAQGGRQGIVRETPRTPLPAAEGSTAVQSEVEWV
ncbi:hypothetical protein [Streptomyces phaeochromogenes]|uniref:Uncharacterized protein n=1 Tax=Streptomyces phaeochromogenes TaxID=1923 RepID=A0ABZ1HIB5_STRPH|nr:hypothetical protein [Streptomyces phaeochromogenes]WSD17814.1 hypothetical protein OHB35_33855 [Streptomyces phaeochromogenes]WTA06768.1 hypothetical protein OHB08_33175 [Streptomyces phaeochromogenes]